MTWPPTEAQSTPLPREQACLSLFPPHPLFHQGGKGKGAPR